MIPFKPITDDEAALAYSPLLKAALLTIGYIEANGPIGLTPVRGAQAIFRAMGGRSIRVAELHGRGSLCRQ